MTNGTGGNGSSLTIKLEDGAGEYMGDGIFVVLQRDATIPKAPMQNTVLSRRDMEAMQGSDGLTLALESGIADYAGDGLWRVTQRDDTTGTMQSVVLSERDMRAMLAATCLAIAA